jgi:hypothetical protein
MDYAIGSLVGVIVTPIVRITGFWYWIEILLVGSFILNGFGLLGKWQVYQIQKKQDEVMKSLDLDDKILISDDKELRKEEFKND